MIASVDATLFSGACGPRAKGAGFGLKMMGMDFISDYLLLGTVGAVTNGGSIY